MALPLPDGSYPTSCPTLPNSPGSSSSSQSILWENKNSYVSSSPRSRRRRPPAPASCRRAAAAAASSSSPAPSRRPPLDRRLRPAARARPSPPSRLTRPVAAPAGCLPRPGRCRRTVGRLRLVRPPDSARPGFPSSGRPPHLRCHRCDRCSAPSAARLRPIRPPSRARPLPLPPGRPAARPSRARPLPSAGPPRRQAVPRPASPFRRAAPPPGRPASATVFRSGVDPISSLKKTMSSSSGYLAIPRCPVLCPPRPTAPTTPIPPTPVALAPDATKDVKDAAKSADDTALAEYDRKVQEYSTAVATYRLDLTDYTQWIDEDARAADVLTSSVLPAEFMGLPTVAAQWAFFVSAISRLGMLFTCLWFARSMLFSRVIPLLIILYSECCYLASA
nr:vegetative cell wall protein gp1-like [Lolium perenne]